MFTLLGMFARSLLLGAQDRQASNPIIEAPNLMHGTILRIGNVCKWA